MYQKLILVAKGFCMGAADVVPGVSGGTMAFILGIYSQLLNAIRSFDVEWLQQIIQLKWHAALQKPHFGFLIPLVIGLVIAVVVFTKIIPLPQLLHSHPELIYGLFFGLVLGSIVTLLPQAARYDLITAIYLPLGIIVGFAFSNLVPVSTPDATWFVFLSGVLAISAMLLPGISGSFILLILNKYELVWMGISNLNLWVIVPFGLGALTGLILFSRVLSWLLAHYERYTLLIIIGILIGSLWKIWPFQERHYATFHGKQKLISASPYFPFEFDLTVLAAFALVLVGFAGVLLLQRLAQQKIV